MREFKRKKFWIDAPLQIKFLAFILILLSATVVVIYLSLDRGLEFTGERAKTLFIPVSQARAALRTHFILSAGISLLASLLLAFLWSHRFVGPLQVLNNAFKRIRDGDLSQEPRIRSTDILQEHVGNAIQMHRELRSQVERDRKLVRSSLEKLARLSQDHTGERKLKETLQDIQEDLGRITSFFRL